MALPVKPQKVQTYGRRRLWLVDTIADPTAPTAAEINAGEYLACYPLADQAGGTSTPNKITLPVLMCETDAEEVFGQTTHAHADIAFAWDPQAASGSPGKKAWDLVKDNFTGFIVWELGEDADEDDQVTSGDFVTVVPSEIRVVSEEPSSTGEDGIALFQTSVAVKAPYIQRNVAVAGA